MDSEKWVNTDTSHVVATLAHELKYFKININKKKLQIFIDATKTYYGQFPFHNFRHAFHVTLTCIHLMRLYTQSGQHIDPDFVLCMVFVSLCHDAGHLGKRNQTSNTPERDGHDKVLVECQYINSYQSINEKNHASIALKLFDTHAFTLSNILKKNQKKQNYYKLLVHNCIIATDISIHTSLCIPLFERLLKVSNSDKKIAHILPIHFGILLIRCADVGHFLYKAHIHLYWVMKLEDELNEDSETDHKHFNVQDIAEKTVSFAKVFVDPLFKILNEILGISSSQTGLRGWSTSKGPTNYIDDLMKNNKPDQWSVYQSVQREHNDGIQDYKDVCICMIDIVNFTQWCPDDDVDRIFNIMSDYNTLVLDIINTFEDIEKIEMVGDSMMVVGGLRGTVQKDKLNISILKFSKKLLESIPEIQKIFGDSRISLRIGIHIGDILIGYVRGPTRIQVFGKAICVASRLEQACVPGTMMVSERLMETLYDNSPGDIGLLAGEKVMMRFKGLPNKLTCAILFVNDKFQSTVLVAGPELNTSHFNAKNITFVSDTFQLKYELYNKYYDILIVDQNFDSKKQQELLHSFRKWENIYRKSQTRIIIQRDNSVIPVCVEENYLFHIVLDEDDVVSSRKTLDDRLETIYPYLFDSSIRGSTIRSSNEIEYKLEIRRSSH